MTELNFFEHKDGKILVNKIFITTVSTYLTEFVGLPYGDKNIESEFKAKIGKLTELMALSYEKQRMVNMGQEYLSKLVIRYGGLDDTRGYDIESFKEDDNGEIEKVFIEVKGTMHEYYQFIWTENERAVAEDIGQNYWLYCYKDVNLDSETAEGPYKIDNAYSSVETDGKFEIKKLKIQVKINI